MKTPLELSAYGEAVMTAVFRDTKRRGVACPASDCGTTHPRHSEEDTWLTPVVLLFDLWKCHTEYNEVAELEREFYLDDALNS